MARTKTYERQILNKIKNINRRMLDIERMIGIDSQQYQRYVNRITAALPVGSYKISPTGKVTISKSKTNLKTLKKRQLDIILKLPTAKQSAKQSKQAIAKNQLKAYGYEDPTDEDIQKLAESITDEQALEELAAKAFIEALEDENGKLKYSEEVKEELSASGNKTYRELRAIIEEGYRRRAANEYALS